MAGEAGRERVRWEVTAVGEEDWASEAWELVLPTLLALTMPSGAGARPSPSPAAASSAAPASASLLVLAEWRQSRASGAPLLGTLAARARPVGLAGRGSARGAAAPRGADAQVGMPGRGAFMRSSEGWCAKKQYCGGGARQQSRQRLTSC